MNKTKIILLITVLWLACTFAVRLVHEPDLWWQIRTGEWILNQGEIPKKDVFSYTYPDQEWVNVKWGFEVIQALITRHLGAEFLPLLQMLTNVLLVFLLWSLSGFFLQKKKNNNPAAALAVLLFLIAFSYRMNTRPEMTTYVLTAVYLFIFHNYNAGHTRVIYTLIPLQMAWVNLHEAFGVGMVMMGVFVVGVFFKYLRMSVKPRQAGRQLAEAVVVVAIAFLANAAHPWGLRMILHPLEIFSQLGNNKFTAEILGITSTAYWALPAYMNLLFLTLSIYALKLLGTEKGTFSSEALLKNVPFFHLVLLLAFFYLSTRAYRNIPFFLLASAPLAAVALHHFLQKLKENTATTIAVAATIFVYFSVVSGSFYQKFLPSEKYGMGINPDKTPVGAARFIQEKNLQGPAYTDYLSSSYLLWALQPDFKTFVDLRDLDIFEEGFIQTAIHTYVNPEMKTRSGFTLWQYLDDGLGFQYVALLNNPQFTNLHRYLIKQPSYHLVYTDRLMSIFVKSTNENQVLLKEYSHQFGQDNYHLTPEMNPSAAAKLLAQIFWPAYQQPQFSPASVSYKTAVQQMHGLP